jgi:hypothetical protein
MNMSLRVKKKTAIDKSFVAGDEFVRALLVGQADVDAETVLGPGPLVARLHDARPRPRDDHIALLADLPGEGARLLVIHFGGFGPGRTEDRDFPSIAVGLEHPKAVTQLTDRAAQDFHIAPRQLGVLGFEGGDDDLPHQIADLHFGDFVRLRALDERVDLSGDFRVPGVEGFRAGVVGVTRLVRKRLGIRGFLFHGVRP